MRDRGGETAAVPVRPFAEVAGGGRSRLRRPLEAALLLAAALLFGRVCTLPLMQAEKAHLAGAPPSWLLPLDDAYIFVRYAQQAARGLHWQWSPGQLSTGASSWLYTWLLVPPHWFSRDLAVWSQWSRLIGVLSLWALGLAGARALRAVRLAEPWPLAGGLCLIWSGPIGFGALAGMESAANAALLVLACALWTESLRAGRAEGGPAWCSPRLWAAVLTALLPLARPENGALVAVAALAVLGGRLPWPRWSGAAILLPGCLLGLADWLATGYFQPAGALVKSWLAWPFLSLGMRAGAYRIMLRDCLLPVYFGSMPTALWPPIGWLAVATAAATLGSVLAGLRRRRTRERAGEARPVPETGKARSAVEPAHPPGPAHGAARLLDLAPFAIAWWILVVLAPISSHLFWQQMRHHHAGLALAWLLGLAGAALALERLAAGRRGGRGRPPVNPSSSTGSAGDVVGAEVVAPSTATASERRSRSKSAAALGWRDAVLLFPLLLLPALPHWARESTQAAFDFFRTHARAAAWLATHDHDRVLMLNDAGLLAVVHDGPVIDVLGLGSPDLTEPSLNGPGAIVEALARHRPRPQIAAVDPALVRLPQLLGEPLIPGAPTSRENVLARVRSELLAGTELEGFGLDFAYLGDERRYRLRWQPPPLAPRDSFALLLPAPPGDAAGPPALQGCRPLAGRVGLELPPGVGRVRLRASLLAFVPLPPAAASQPNPSPARGEERGARAAREGEPAAPAEREREPGATAALEGQLRARVVPERQPLADAQQHELVAGLGDEDGPSGEPLAATPLAADRWSDLDVQLPARYRFLWIARRGAGIPCLESARFFPPPRQ